MTARFSKYPVTHVLGSVLICCSLIISNQVFAAKELSFCPAGGPTGWLNHFNYKRDKNILSHYQRKYPGRPFPYRMKSPHPRYHPFYTSYFQPFMQRANGPYVDHYRRSW